MQIFIDKTNNDKNASRLVKGRFISIKKSSTNQRKLILSTKVTKSFQANRLYVFL